MRSQTPPDETPRATPVPRSGIAVVAIILVVIGAVAVFSNVQRLRRDRIETVTVSAASPSPSASTAVR